MDQTASTSLTASSALAAERFNEPMSISRLLGDGYNVYRKPEALRVDCAEMRTLEDHLWHLSEVFQDVGLKAPSDPAIRQEAVPREWPRVSRWLQMAAGLRCVDIDIAYGEPYLPLCGRAEEYHAAASNVASVYVTEQARLQYTWNATERLLKVLRLPAVSRARGNFNAATKLLHDHWAHREPLAHVDCVLRHLRAHAEGDPELCGGLQAALQEAPWRGQSGLLLAAANQLRHVPAHGDLAVPQPGTWGEDEPPPSEHVARLLHAPRLASRGLALSLQMLLLAAKPLGSLHGWRTPGAGWWVLGTHGTWHREREPDWLTLLAQAHQMPPCREDDRLDDEDDGADD